MTNSTTLKESELCEKCFEEELNSHRPYRVEAEIDLLDDYLIKTEEVKGGTILTIDQVDPAVRLVFSDYKDLKQFTEELLSKAIGADHGRIHQG